MTDPGYKPELPESETEIVEPKMDKKALDTLCTKMSNLQGEFLKNADSLAWLLKLMAARDHQNSQARAAISAARKICISNAAFMTQTRDYVARSLPDRTQRSGLLNAYIETGTPTLQRDLDDLLTAVVREQNEEKTTVLKAAVVDSEDRITVTMGIQRAEISSQIQGIVQQLTALS